MVKAVMEFQEEAAGLRSIPPLQETLVQTLTSLGFPYFSYAWSDSPSIDQIAMDSDSFFTNINDNFFVPYIRDGIFLYDYSIHACRGTTTIRSLIGKTWHRWREVSRNEMNPREQYLDDFEKAFFVDGVTSVLENRDERFFSGASLIGQDMSLREFNHPLKNAPRAFWILRIYHERFHVLRREAPALSRCRQDLAAGQPPGAPNDVGGATMKMTEHGLLIPERSIIVAQKYEINAAVVNVIEHNAAPINIDARAMDVEMAGCGDDGSQAAGGAEGFDHSPDYRRVRLRGAAFRFGAVQAAIIRILHDASKASCPWVPERQLLDEAKSSSEDLRRAFPNHDRGALFEADDLGRVRLRL